MNNISDFQKCANCGACYNICPADAISVIKDKLFYEVSVNETRCIHCGLCKEVCPVNATQFTQKVIRCYSGINNDSLVVQKSSSGGVFSALADIVLQHGGIVYGAAFTENFREVEIHSTEEHDLDALRRSKYVESLVGYSFRTVKSQLDEGIFVLYSGAPCQIAGLKSFLGKEYENLLTCDFSCGGMPSHKIYQEYMSHIESNLGSRIINVNFRPKKYGWTNHAILISTNNQQKYCVPAVSDPYFDCFIGKNRLASVRDYCLSCKFANNHCADIILADFWKYKSISNVRNENRGISLIITNSSKGEVYVKKLSKKIALTTLDKNSASYNLVKKKTVQTVVENRLSFLEQISQKGFIEITKNLKYKSVIGFKIKYYIKKAIGRD